MTDDARASPDTADEPAPGGTFVDVDRELDAEERQAEDESVAAVDEAAEAGRHDHAAGTSARPT